MRILVYMVTAGIISMFTANSMANEPYEPVGLYLTWQQDPTTTMTIDWHTVPDQRPQPPSLLYKEENSGSEWKKAPGTMHPFPYTSRTINRVELTGLKPGTSYLFRIGPSPSERYPFPESRIYKFRTMPEFHDRTIRFAVGGDTGDGDGFRSVARQAMVYDLDFVTFGGDLAYSEAGDRDWRRSDGEFIFPDGNESKRRWLNWFDVVKDKFITDDGRVIPILSGIGNHEVWRDISFDHPEYEQTDVWRERLAPIYFNIFAFPGQPGYAVLDFNDYMSIILLDTDHANSVTGQQTEWLERILSDRQHIPNIFPNYHVPAFPSVRNPAGRTNTRVRDTWVPLFEKYNVSVVFENHDHTYKRTYPIRNGKVDPKGVVYLGDGAFGKGERHGIGGRRERMHDVDEMWYLKHAYPYDHFILVTLNPDGSSLFEAIRYDGSVIDRYQPE